MRKLFVACTCLALLAAFASAEVDQLISRGPDAFGGYTTDYVLVRFKHGQVPQALKLGASRTGAPMVDQLSQRWRVSRIDPIQPTGYGDPVLAERLGLSRTYEFRVPHGTDVIHMAQAYQKLPNVEFAEVDGIGGIAYTPNDSLISNCYGLNNTGQTGGTAGADIRAFSAWDIWKGGANITLAIVDTGADWNHVELQGKLIPGWNTYDNNSNTQDGHGHGTHTSGTAGANSDNGIGIAGVSFGVKIMPVRVLSSGGSGTEAQCGAGLVWAADHGANICSMSLQYYQGTQTFHDNVDYAFNKGVLLIAANGNNQGNLIAYPAKFSNCLGIAATTDTDAWAGFSNYGPECDLAAPGEDVYSLKLGGGYTTMSGTSMATPHVSGLASLVWSFDRGLTNTEVYEDIRTTVDDKGAAGWDQFYGWGRVNAQKAILEAKKWVIGFDSLTIDNGVAQSGGLGQLYDSDDQYAKVQAWHYPSAAAPNVRYTVSGTAPNLTFRRLQLLVESSARSGVLQVVEAYDTTTNNWVVVDQRAAPAGDAYTVVNITNSPERFLDANRLLKARVSFYGNGVPSAAWTVRLDQFRGALRAN